MILNRKCGLLYIMKGKIIYYNNNLEIFRYIHFEYGGIMLRDTVFGHVKLV